MRSWLAFVAAMAVGTLLGLPGMMLRLPMFQEWTFLLATSPASDEALGRWLAADPPVTAHSVARVGDELRVRTEWRGLTPVPSHEATARQLRESGYVLAGMKGGRIGVPDGTVWALARDPGVLACSMAGIQVSLGCIALWRLRVERRRSGRVRLLLDGSWGRGAGWGLAGGCLLLGWGMAYSLVLERILGGSAPSPWSSAGTLPWTAKLVVLAIGVFVAPVAEELFFRGYLFGRMAAAGWRWPAYAVSTLLFAGAHFSDPYHVPAILFHGLTLAWLFERTRTLAAPVTAHAANNLVGLLVLVSAGS